MDGITEHDPIEVKPVLIPLCESSTDSDEEEEEEEEEENMVADDAADSHEKESSDDDDDDNDELVADEATVDQHAVGTEQVEEHPGSAFKCNFCKQTFQVFCLSHMERALLSIQFFMAKQLNSLTIYAAT